VTRIALVEPILVQGALFVEVTTESGIVGTGQSACWGYPAAVAEVVRAAGAYLIGQDPRRVEHHWQYLCRMAPFRGNVLSGAVSALDIALWDIKGQLLQAPIWDLLGGNCRDRVRLHLLMEGGSPDQIAAHVRAAVGEGFNAIKFDPVPDGYENMTLDALIGGTVERVAAARETIGSAADIIVELHRKLTPLQALPLCDALARFRPLFIEDPIQIDSIQSQAEIARRLTTAIANGERMTSIWEFRELLVAGGTQYLRPDLGLAGGITHCKKIAAIGEAFHASVVTHNFLGPVLTAAAVHLDVSIPNFLVQEYSMLDERVADAFPGTLRRKDGYLPLPQAPGLGVRIDRGRLPEHTRPMWDPRLGLLRADGSVARAV